MAATGPRWQDDRGEAVAPGDMDVDVDDLSCPVCGTELVGAERFETYRVCPVCNRHFVLPARERLLLLVDPGSFSETNAALVSADPLRFGDPLPSPDRLAEARERSVLSEAVITGAGAIGGHEAILILLDFAYLGSNIGVVAGEKIALAMEQAAARRLPLIAVCSGGGARTQQGMLSLVQLAKTTAAATRLRREGVPFISVLTHPTLGGVYAGLANQADIVLAEPGAQIGFSFSAARVSGAGIGTNTAESLLAHGMIDGIVGRGDLRDDLGTLLDLFAMRGTPQPAPPQIAVGAGGALPTWEAAALARHAERPTARDYIARLVPDFVELHGDRVAGDDPAVVCGLGRFAGTTVAVVAQERGRGHAHAARSGGRMRPEGYRKAVRVMRLAGHLELPLVTLVDTPGAADDDAAERDGIGVAIAQAFGAMSTLPAPIVTAVIGEGGSAGALALGIGDRMLMQEHAVYSVAGPESAAEAASPTLTARDCLRLGVVDAIVPEPSPAAHADPAAAAALLGAALAKALTELTPSAPRRLLAERARRVRTMGQTTPEGREATRREIRELQELQRTLARSLGELRARWDARNPSLPHLGLNLNLNLRRPDLTDLADRLPHRADLVDLAGRLQRPDLADLAGRIAALRSNAAHEAAPEELSAERNEEAE